MSDPLSHEVSGDRPWTLDRLVRFILSILIVLGLIWLIRYLSDVLIPFAIALVLAYLINPLVNWVERRFNNRVVATLTVVFGLLLVGLLVLLFAIPFLGSELSSFVDSISGLAPGSGDMTTEGINARFEALVESQDNKWVREGLLALRDSLLATVHEWDDMDIREMSVGLIKRIAPGLLNLVSGTLSLILGAIGLVIILLYLIFLLIDYRSVSVVWKEYLPPKHRGAIIDFVEEFSEAMRRYFRGQFLIASTVGILFAIGFSIIGLRMAILLGLFVGLLNMVPYLQTIGMFPAIGLAIMRALETGGNVTTSIVLVLVVFGVVQLIQDAILTPRIMGKETGLRPVVILLGIFIWGKLLGFLGLILAIPLTCLGLAFYRRQVLKHKNVRAIQDA